ncbi:MAG: tagatose 1,6-diphosphate aldolase [Terriglobales bacterium]
MSSAPPPHAGGPGRAGAAASADPPRPGKREHLAALADATGRMAIVAVDHRGNLRAMLAKAAGRDISDAELAGFKAAVVRGLSGAATAVLLDPEYGLAAAGGRARSCGLLLAYEKSGYDNTRPGRRPDLLPLQSVARLRAAGAQAVKILLHFTPLEAAEINEEKRAFIERIGAECRDQELPFFLEILTYDPSGQDGVAWWRQRPRLIAAAAEEFSHPRYGVDVLKLELPVAAERCGSGPEAAYTRAEALVLAREALAPAGPPVVFLSGGASAAAFTAGLELVAEAGVSFAGALCGRAIWQEGIPPYMAEGAAGLERWLATEGQAQLAAVRACLARCGSVSAV